MKQNTFLKKGFAFLLAGIMALGVTACGGGTPDKADDAKPSASEEAASEALAEQGDAKPEESAETSTESTDKIKIGMTLYSLKNEFTVRLANAAQRKADEMGIELEIYDGNYDVSTQIGQVDTMIANGCNGIILNPQDAQALAVAVDTAVAANIPIVGVNTRVESDKLTSYVGSLDVMAGEMEMQTIADKIGGKGKVVIIEGPLGQSAQIERKEGIYNILAKYPDIEVLAEKTANWSRSESMTLMETWLNTFEEIDAVVAENDEMALGARQAIEAKGLDIPCIGVDGITDALAAVEEGRMIASIFQDGAGQGSKAFEVVVAAVKGESVEKEYWIDFEEVTKENVEEFKQRAQ